MKVKRITANVYEISLGRVNAFVIEDEELTLVDTGAPGQAGLLMDAVTRIGRDVRDIRHILLTHSHPDHSGNAAELKRVTGAKIYMHAAEVQLLQQGDVPKPDVPYFPGFVHKMMYRLFIRNTPGSVTPVEVDEVLADGDWLPMAGGIHVIHAPGHSAGQLAFFVPGQRNVLFAADAAMNVFGLGYSIFYEQEREAMHTLERLSTFDFDIACFGHGRTILHEAAERFRQKFLKPHPVQKSGRQTPYLVLRDEEIIRLQEPEERI
ncbi:MBL fold metallo-hydrolase [Chitinophaga sp. XS-30]|uniref:MBL fold metallo-hydrolase n=1 Tax=Chitinophaga sp. XS-30 TaxID=2604421 RepID=UPI0011DE36CD|nr:MBL fold metallo-hydrolase [Chitinophaga sp. XS-30]QEH42823.1 MBL fold metallo-hydrolase [Chitinophaga sp. XS-30]